MVSRNVVLAPVLAVLCVFSACEGCEVNPLGVLPEPGAVRGRVCDPGDSGEGLFGARVFVVIEFGDGSTGEIETITEADGSFLLEDLPPGNYSLNVARGSFTAVVDDVEILEAQETELGPDTCVAPVSVRMRVYDGHDSVEGVLVRLGFTDFEVVPTFHRNSSRDENTPSWIVEEFGDFANIDDFDILFINCAAHEWALDAAPIGEVQNALSNLRRFVDEGGSLYFSDWSYDLLERLYPDAVDWYGDDLERNYAELAVSQFFVGDILDENIAGTVGSSRATLRYELGRVAAPVALGEGSRALITADVDLLEDDTEFTVPALPVLLEHRPPNLPAGSDGRIIYTTFHNGDSNNEDTDAVLRAIVFEL